MVQANINIKVTEDVKDALNRLKLHPREPYHEVIAKLIEVYAMMRAYKEESLKGYEKDLDLTATESMDLLREVYKRL